MAELKALPYQNMAGVALNRLIFLQILSICNKKNKGWSDLAYTHVATKQPQQHGVTEMQLTLISWDF